MCMQERAEALSSQLSTIDSCHGVHIAIPSQDSIEGEGVEGGGHETGSRFQGEGFKGNLKINSLNFTGSLPTLTNLSIVRELFLGEGFKVKGSK